MRSFCYYAGMKKIIRTVFWIAVAGLGGFATAVVCGIIRPSENVDALWMITAAVCFFAVAYRFSTIWPMFGVANQILAAIALGVGTTIIIKSGRARYIWVTLVPMSFMTVTTLTAAVKSIAIFEARAAAAATHAEALSLHIDSILVAVMAILAVIAISDMVIRWFRHLVFKQPWPLAEAA